MASMLVPAPAWVPIWAGASCSVAACARLPTGQPKPKRAAARYPVRCRAGTCATARCKHGHRHSASQLRWRDTDTGGRHGYGHVPGWQGLRQAGSLQNVTSGAWRSSLCAGAAQLHCTTGRPTSFRGMRSPKQWGASPRNPAGAVAYSPSAQPITSLNTPSGPG